MSWAAVCRFGGVGDNLIASSVLPGLKKKYDHIEVLSQAPQSQVFENNPFIDKLTVKERGDIPGGGKEWQDWFSARAKEYDFFINLSHSCETLRALVPSQSQFYWPAAFRRKMCGQNYLETVHDACDISYDKIGPEFYPKDAENEQALQTKSKIGKKVIAWVIRGTRLDKIYPPAPLAIARIIKELGEPVILMGAPGKDWELATTIQEHVARQNGSGDGLHVAISKDEKEPNWPIRRVLTLAQQCDLVIGPDTGPMWAVAMLDMPKIMLLSHASEENITKYWKNTLTLHADPKKVKCWPCHQLHDVPETCTPNASNTGASCISSINIDDLISKVKDLWNRKSVGEDDDHVPLDHCGPRVPVADQVETNGRLHIHL